MAYNNNNNKDGPKDSDFGDDQSEVKPHNKMKTRYVKGIKAEILKGLICRGMKAEKLKSFINGSIKADKLKGMEFIAKVRLARLKQWAIRATTVLLLWAILMQIKALCQTFPRVSNFSFPPPSMYIFVIHKLFLFT